jgi:hypothetical protein
MGTWEHIKLTNSLFLFPCFFTHFVEEKYFHGNMGTYQIGRASPNIMPCPRGEIPQNTHRNKKRE